MTKAIKTKTEAGSSITLPATGRGTWRHPAFPGLELLGNAKGASWYLRHRIEGKRVRDLIGRWPALPADAAQAAAAVRVSATAVQAAAGTDVLAARVVRQEAKRTRRDSITLGELLDVYKDDRLKGKKSGDHAVQVIRLVFGKLLPKLLVDLTTTDLTSALEAKRKTAPATAATAVRYAKPFFGWISETKRGDNLLAGVKATQTNKRDRTLTLLELGHILRALDVEGDSTGALTARFLLATAGRLEEASGLRRSEVDLTAALWTLPASRNKSGREHLVPLNREAIAVLQQATGTDMVFTGRTGETPFSGWSRFKARIDRVSGVTGWVWHDARRTFATIMADRGVDAHVADRCLNHSGAGTLSGVARIYQRSTMIDQRRVALDLWSDAMDEARALADGQTNVVALRA